MMRIGYLIDVGRKVVEQVDIRDLAHMQEYVGGYIEVAFMWPNHDTLYVDEEGLFKPKEGAFLLRERPDQVLMGNGLMVGREIGETSNTAPPKMTLDELRARVLMFVPWTETERKQLP